MDLQRGSIRIPESAPEAPLFRPGAGSSIVHTTSGVPAFNLRIPRDLRAKLEESAHRNGRSLNSEIIQALQSWLGGYTRL